MGLALEEPQDTDILEVSGLSIMMDATVKGFSDGQVLDFIDDKRGSGFIIQSGRGGCSSPK